MPGDSIVYVDGFNLYYGALKGSPYKWLDLEAYFKRIRPNDRIRRIQYFTARVKGKSDQAAYLSALSTRPIVHTEFGLFKSKRIQCGVSSCSYTGDRRFPAFEEKGTDVNIALRMLDDAYQQACDQLILVSADSDLVPALKLIRQRFPQIRIVVYLPYRDVVLPDGSVKHNPRGAARELRSVAHRCKQLPLAELGKAQFPDPLPDGKGGFIQKPSSW
ncbi:NYN domain-containing protein [Calidithermus roseus]|uniref:6-hydroxy-3-succinoylpyridine 3-monooxygenase HspA n=1 Tax=Calidithermus roseus TaxID=1644118 RepID=A0A399EXF8_9DEIN|nr:NYN domain-containing protein [Calidithermus roseus]RIH88698.1 6-hydroxy-3-succinoylpyridine 3-monooxygenase HspA [Calidithermus roseus]